MYTNDWITGSGSEDSEIYNSFTSLRNRARDLDRNDATVEKYGVTMVVNVIGPNGFTLQMKSQNRNGEIDTEMCRHIEEKWKKWGECADVSERETFRGLTELALRCLMREGESFFRLYRGWNGNKYGFALQALEADFIDHEYNGTLSNGNIIRMGIEMDQYRRRVAYYMLAYNPQNELRGSGATKYERIRVPANEIVHVMVPKRPNQTRGVTWMASAMFYIRQLKGYMEAAVINARIGASKMGVIEKASPAVAAFQGDSSDSYGNKIVEMAPGRVIELEPGQTWKNSSPDFPTSEHVGFVKSIVRFISNALKNSYAVLANDLESVNYSSMRAGTVEDREYYKLVQTQLEEKFLRPVFYAWLKEAILNSAVNANMSDWDSIANATFVGRRWGWVDPVKDAQAAILRITAGIDTLEEIHAEMGKDTLEVFQSAAKVQKLAEKYGLNFTAIPLTDTGTSNYN